jgi:hypothetical protein
MFAEDPNARAMKSVTAFMFGNGIQFEIAVECYIACNRYRYNSVIDEAVYSWYFIWNRFPYVA